MMNDQLEGVKYLHVLGSAIAGPDGGGASVCDVDESRRGDDGGGQGGCGVLGPNGGDANFREVGKCRRWDDGGVLGGGGSASVGGADRSRGGDSGGGRGRDLHVNEDVGDVVDAVFRDGVRTRLERVHAASRVSCAAKDETSVDIMGRKLCCNLLRKSRFMTNLAIEAIDARCGDYV
jgi:hypothetical protein